MNESASEQFTIVLFFIRLPLSDCNTTTQLPVTLALGLTAGLTGT